jgi:uncharacterized protein YbjT (DUF2867 family)
MHDMNYVITGSLGHISKVLAQKLIAAGHTVTVVSSKEDKRNEIESLGGRAAIGSVEDAAFLLKTFTGADAVYTMVPPTFSPKDWKKHIATVGANYADAIRKAGVKYVVNLSSIGAHMPEGCGPVSGLHFAEKALNDVESANVLHLRPGYFYYNFYAQLGMIRNLGFIGGNYGKGGRIVLVHTNDIAEAAAQALLNLDFKNKSYRYVAGDVKTTDEIAKAIGTAIGRPELNWVDFSDEDNLAGLIQAGLPEEIAKNYTEMGTALRSGEMISDFENQKAATNGKVKLADFAREFAAAYSADPVTA